MEFGPVTIGCIGVVALLALCFVGVRFAFAGAIAPGLESARTARPGVNGRVLRRRLLG